MMRLITIACALTMAATAWGAQSTLAAPTPAKTPRAIPAPKIDKKIRLWQGDAPGFMKGAPAEAIVNERIKYVSTPELFVYLPDKPKQNATALIICPGGGFNHLAMNLHVENVARMLNGKGIVVFGLKYRTKLGKNDYVADSQADALRAVRVVRSRAKEFGIDPHKIGIQGYSAGSTVILNLLGHFDNGNPKAADPVGRISSRPDFAVLMCPWPNEKTLEDYPLPKNTPPVFIAHARDDEAAPYAFAVALDEKLKKMGTPERMFSVDRGGHSAFHYGDTTGEGVAWPDKLMEWLKEIGM
ncbi:alpha/beta hydrolase [bacterium]|nr:alpha/beta hydrolase [bacterium]